jgi:sarcosine oxidase
LSRFDTIVVGVGGMGSATCYQLANRGQQVLGLEQFDIPHTQGSSHGSTRIIRLAYYEGSAYVPLLRRAYELWGDIERESGEQLFNRTGSVDIGTETSQVFSGSLASCITRQIPHEVLTGTELNRRFPGYQVLEDYRALYQPDGGFLLPERATVAFVEAAQQRGAVVHAREKVQGWEPVGEGVRVKTDRAVYETGALVFIAGAWNGSLVPGMAKLAVLERQVLAWLQPLQPEVFTPERFPVFNMQVGGARYYGCPIFGVPGFKFDKYRHLYEQGPPESFDWEPNAADEAVLREYAAEMFPLGTGPTMSLKTCLFTNSPDDHSITDLLPDTPQVAVAAGFSGHGYKFASVIGEIMADLATERSTALDIGLFTYARFGDD